MKGYDNVRGLNDHIYMKRLWMVSSSLVTAMSEARADPEETHLRIATLNCWFVKHNLSLFVCL